jgi:hypothetical protein
VRQPGRRDHDRRAGPGEAHERRRPVGVAPLMGCLLRLLPVLAPWALLVVGRAVCLAAQRVPPVVVAVRAVRARGSRRTTGRRAEWDTGRSAGCGAREGGGRGVT